MFFALEGSCSVSLPPLPSTMTMEELLKSLQKKCRVECEEAHRQLVCALNGLAGIHIIRSINPHSCTFHSDSRFPMGISLDETQEVISSLCKKL